MTFALNSPTGPLHMIADPAALKFHRLDIAVNKRIRFLPLLWVESIFQQDPNTPTPIPSRMRFFEPISDLASAKHFRWVVLAGSLTWCPNTFWTRLPEPLPSASPHDHMHLYKTCPIGSPQHFSHWVSAKHLRSDSPEKTSKGGPQSICDRPSWGYVALARSEACPMASPQRIFIHSS